MIVYNLVAAAPMTLSGGLKEKGRGGHAAALLCVSALRNLSISFGLARIPCAPSPGLSTILLRIGGGLIAREKCVKLKTRWRGAVTIAAAPAPSGSAGGPPAGGGGMTLTYGSGYYYLAFLGTPSVDGTWQLDFGGHHLATHLTYTKGRAVSASPFFIGVEPISYTDDSGATVESMKAQKTAMAAIFTEKRLAAVTLDQSFGDVLVGRAVPGGEGRHRGQGPHAEAEEAGAGRDQAVGGER
ncbi:DUF3500 domain-containing protein [Actinoplanes sp. NPDC026670]|uniref:DUF3500 domain-containing protein n=1 Tax=Actinoplanes sp. NPDC026670 TaxID=3154700 RepID=UPI0033F1D45C